MVFVPTRSIARFDVKKTSRMLKQRGLIDYEGASPAEIDHEAERMAREAEEAKGRQIKREVDNFRQEMGDDLYRSKP